ncbi:MAG TPA: hypothetical protein DEW97_02625 [Sutterella wadsworthensis]|nr:hypothetical protein [Sutterella wadsworthensis]OLA93206.1 MAG: hypothetical protein BHW60_06170 [Sutterella sp. 54_7]HCE87924.1 hypothetical protein [Sutterella wadsworthensis]HCG92483.1 hypothetical protein [Sutterella wadsworthensis]
MDAFESSKALRNSFFSQHAHRLNARSVEGRHQYAVMAMEVRALCCMMRGLKSMGIQLDGKCNDCTDGTNHPSRFMKASIG